MFLKLNQKGGQVRYEDGKVLRLAPESGSPRRREVQALLNEGNTNTGIAQAARARLTPSESKKLEEQEILHELTCGGSTIDLPDWTLDSITIPFAVFCHTCNRMIAPGMEETYLG